MIELFRRIKNICGGSVDLDNIKNETDLFVLDNCLYYESQHNKRKTMIKALKSRIKNIEKNKSKQEEA